MEFDLRTAGPPGTYKDAVRRVFSLLAPDIALEGIATVEEALADNVYYYTFLRRILLEIAGLGLLLSAIGIYGVAANLASERTKEVGIRMALGAQSRSILWLFLRDGIQLAVIGAGIGLAAAYFLVATLHRILPAVPGKDPRTIALMSLVLVGVALVASWLPARRSTKVNPIVALRAEERPRRGPETIGPQPGAVMAASRPCTR